eukprot:snap_masked-scaffold_10-processed-gene-12.25-mRNA-1 protein AED:1.00 eAED:1.00 QI:0/0/0/0/1/1/4/0/194
MVEHLKELETNINEVVTICMGKKTEILNKILNNLRVLKTRSPLTTNLTRRRYKDHVTKKKTYTILVKSISYPKMPPDSTSLYEVEEPPVLSINVGDLIQIKLNTLDEPISLKCSPTVLQIQKTEFKGLEKIKEINQTVSQNKNESGSSWRSSIDILIYHLLELSGLFQVHFVSKKSVIEASLQTIPSKTKFKLL